MLNRLYAALRGEPVSTGKLKQDDLQVAVGALLVESATRDDEFGDDERKAIEALLEQRFDLSATETAELLQAAETAKHGSMELFGFIRKVMKEMDEAQRIEVVEMLWDVAYADGVLDPHEDAMIRKVAGLLYVSDFDRGAARRRVRERRGLGA